MAGLQLTRLTSSEASSASGHKSVIVGLYGIPGSGKTFLLNQLKQELEDSRQYAFYDGSDVIASVVPGGLHAFEAMEEQDKTQWRQHAIDAIGKNCADSGKVGVVAGHFMFWSEEQEAPLPVYTQNDLNVYTHILYLDVSTDVVAQRRLADTKKNRPSMSVSQLKMWQEKEKNQLRDLCRHHCILFSLIIPNLKTLKTLLHDFRCHTEEYNLTQAKLKLDDAIAPSQGSLDAVLLMDADRTLAAEDTGALFWKIFFHLRQVEHTASPLEALFSSPLAYSYVAFRQAVLLYEAALNDQDFDDLCEHVALAVSMYPDFLSLLQVVAEQTHVRAVVITSGLRRVWDKVLEREGLSAKVKVVGGGRLADGFVVTETVKGAMVDHLRRTHQIYVWAFGDSPLDLDMLRRADRAIVVVGEEQTRSKSMDAALAHAINNEGLQANQVVLPSSASPRLKVNDLPLINLIGPNFLESLLGTRYRNGGLGLSLSTRYTHGGLEITSAAHRNAAKLLATRMRDAAVAGPYLREAHRRVGWYLANEFLANRLGLEYCPIMHVLGHETRGYRLLHEKQTVIAALMRGGEPMASGVNDAFPLAMFVHASEASDLKFHHLEGRVNVILVDSVVNTGKTIVDFVQHIRNLHATIRIAVVAGVVQDQCVDAGSDLKQALARYANLSVIALRLSETKFVGTGTTDTGNRLFNTTHLL